MSGRRVRPGLVALALGTLVVAIGSEWAVRRAALSVPLRTELRCDAPPILPAPAIGAESGASTITALYERHPTLGWVPTPESHHAPATGRIPPPAKPWIGLFGDGSLAGPLDLPGGPIPEQLARKLDRPVVSYAVSGHDLQRIVARYRDTLDRLASRNQSPDTTLIAFRVDALERLAEPPEAAGSLLDRSRLVALLRAGWDDRSSDEKEPGEALDCYREPDPVRLRNLLGELRRAAEQSGAELIVSLHPPAVPEAADARYRALLHRELDDQNIHRIDAWAPAAEHGPHERITFATKQLETRLATRADYVWGDRVGFGKQEEVSAYRTAGFREPGADFRWMMSRVAKIELSPPSTDGGIIGEVELAYAMTFDEDTRELVLRVGEVAVGRWPLNRLRRRLRDSFFIDEGLAATRPLAFRFELESLRSPKEIGIGENEKKYGAAVRSLTLRPDARNLAP